ncbi:YDG domain-containing protein [uncultured Selenomonas sp.]|uniref:YDG domain-containing protein n=1 Tax=uncultured Selenomonas sp. TaxID=159275 RepID=UPI0028E66EA7|nr:YDG domain-containing protein [uncultured Selenomonas sp.]
MKHHHAKRLYHAVVCALFAGIVTAPFAAQTAYALPIEGANAATNKTEADISTSGAVMDIAGKTEHNILRWEDFSIDAGEKVRFDGGAQTRDYLNLVTGEGASNIYGTIEGGRNVYLVNPHGILFAQGSQVNTGALYLSTANPADVANAAGASWDGTSPLSATAQTGDVLNLGTVKAAKLYIEGKNVKVLNTDAVTDANGTALTGANVTIRSEDAPHIGYDVANTTTRNFTVNGATVSKNVSDYKNANTSKSATSRTWVVTNLGGTAHGDYDYMRVHDVYELQHMDANQIDDVDPDKRKILGRYMLADDINASETKDWDTGFQPIGDVTRGTFRGRFDGVGHTITGLTIKPPTDTTGEVSRGMFAYIEHARIENVSLKGASVSGLRAVGGIVGSADWSAIRNVSFSGEVHGGGTGLYDNCAGGIVGELKNQSRIENAYNEGTIEGAGAVGGIVGYVFNNSTVQNVRNAGKVLGNRQLGGIAGSVEWSSVRNAVQTGTVEQRAGQGDPTVGGVVGLLHDDTVSHAVWKEGSVKDGNGDLIRKGVGKEQGNTTVRDVEKRTEAQMKLAETYKEWKDGNEAVVATEGGKRTPWRIYDGKTMPLLKAFLRTKHLANREQVYDGTAPTIAGGDGITWQAGKDVGTYHAYSEQYDITGGAYKVVPKELMLNFTSGTRFYKTYDGGRDTATRTLTKGQHYNLGGFVGSDGSDVELAGAVTGTYADKNAGKDKEVTFQNLALTGTGAKNYTIKKARGVGTIAPKQLTLDLVGSTRFNKTYDGNANVTQSLTKGTHYTLTGFVTGEGTGIELASSTGTYTDKNVAADKAVTFGGLTLTGAGAGNYTLDKTALTGIGTIARRALTLGAVAAQTKTYDGNTLADTSKFRAALNNVVAGEENSVKATATGAAYNSKNVAAASAIDYTGVALSGAEAGNYSLAATTAQGTGTITKRALTVDTVAAQSKTYDGTTAADTSKFQATLGNFVAGEEGSVAATAAGATYNDKNVAGANKVGYTGLALTGAGAGNYTLAATTAEGAGRITPKKLNLALANGARFDKTYDGNANVTQSLTKGGNYTLTGFVGTEGTGIELKSATGRYADKNAGTDKNVTFDGLSLTGTGAGNYALDKSALTGTGTITRRALTLGAVGAQSKTYDGTIAADASKFRAALGNAIAGDDVKAAAATATFNDKNVASANAVGYTGVAIAGADAGNYSLAATTAQGAGEITHRDLTLTADAASVTQGGSLPAFTGKAQGFADGEDGSVFGADGVTFMTAVADTNTPGSYAVIGKAGGVTDGVLGNYRIRQAAGNATAFTIHAAALPGGLLAALVQDAAPRFDLGFGDAIHIYGTPRPIRAATLGLYRFDAEEGLEIQGLSL